MKPTQIFRILLFVVVANITGNAQAGIYTDDLSRCLVESTTSSDKVSFVKWMFSAMALHPAVKSFSSITESQRDAANKTTAGLFMNLLTVSCKEQSQKAVKYEGRMAIQAAFQVLGQVAAGELMANPEVAAGLAGLNKYFDEEKLDATFGKSE